MRTNATHLRKSKMAAAARASLLRGEQGREEKIWSPQGTTPDTKLPPFLNLFAHSNIHILSYGVSYLFFDYFWCLTNALGHVCSPYIYLQY